MNKLTPFCVFLSLLLVVVSIYFRLNPNLPFYDVMIDRRNMTWRIPTSGSITKMANAIISAFPRIDNSFTAIEPQFDMDNPDYMESNTMYIILFGLIGFLFMVGTLSFIMARYLCGCCGGKTIRRKGYKENEINFFRYSLIVISFLLEGILIYGYFANTDLHSSLSTLTDTFTNISGELENQFEQIKLPDHLINVDVNLSLFDDDLQFSARYAAGQTASMKGFLDTFETYRMVIIICNLVAATLGCSLGIAAGSVRKGTPVLIMVILFSVSCCLFFFSLGIHFSGSKIVYDFCEEVSPYIEVGNDTTLPMRLQYFVPCVASPIFPFIMDHFVFESVSAVNTFSQQAAAANNTIISAYPPHWFNITNSTYSNLVLSYPALATSYTDSVNKSDSLSILDRHYTCRWSKNELRLESFLLCHYAKDNLDMIMLTQGAGCFVLIILSILGIPAIKRFKYAGNANIGGVLVANDSFLKNRAKAKR